ncbi:hypothetical protein Q4485_09310 [Granulosicoccaceae sp. 1_MG-2023]|nr:hypothetical protein [Granulosicoccaceae sp. 1_MG-2023]
MTRPQFRSLVIYFWLCLTLSFNGAMAQQATEPEALPTEPTQTQLDAVTRLDALQESQAALDKRLREVNAALQKADETDKPALETERDALEKDIERLKRAFEQVAIGGVDLNFLEPEEEGEFDWQQELIEIMQPLLENVKVLTEKPRKIEKLRSSITLYEDRNESIEKALQKLMELEEVKATEATRKRLESLIANWQRQKQENNDAIELAQFQLRALQGDNVSWWEALRESVNEFLSGRGLTLLVAMSAAATVWLVMRFLLWISRRRVRDPRDRTMTRYRLAAYAYSALTTILMVVAAIIVFYVRGDVLLLGLSILLLAGAALGLRNTLPRFISETKLLLNVGALREGERVIYKGVPWQVSSLNLYTTLKNPAIDGVIRLPLSELAGMTSRPVSAEPWFPHEQQDYLLMPNGKLAQIIRITPDITELRYGGGAAGVISTAELYTLDALNLTRNGSFGVAGVFGIDYAHQSLAISEVTAKFRNTLQTAIDEHGLAEHLQSMLVDFKSAGSSSLDYLIYLTFDSKVAPSYFSIERLIQQACVKACNEENWGIPFPQMTLHSGDFRVTSDSGSGQ